MALTVLPIVAYIMQLQLRWLTVPWYLPVVSMVAVLLLVAAFLRRRSVFRAFVLVLVGVLTAGEWFALLVLPALPPYTGPVAVGKPFPVFQTVRADGSAFTQADLKGDRETVLVFFRGRW